MDLRLERRGFLKGLGLAAAGSVAAGGKCLAGTAAADPFAGLERLPYPVPSYDAKLDRPLTAVVVGYGGRGTCYCEYALNFPGSLKMVGACDIDGFKVKQFCERYQVAPENCFAGDFRNWRGLREKVADLMFICLPDALHYEPAIKAMELGYDVLLEKPMAQTEQECRDLLKVQERTQRIVGICHVLRYAPYFSAMRGCVADGRIGELVSVQHMEPIDYVHMTHSYVRGRWHDSKATTPIILAKSCHDLDIIKWMVDRPCKTVSAEGGLKFFRRENCPKGAPLRCHDGCPHERECPYSACKIYPGLDANGRVRGGWNWTFNIDHLIKDPPAYEAALARILSTTDYGKCVFQCDNDQCDHYVANLVFEGGATAAFSMEAFTPFGGRRTRLMGTHGYIEGDGGTFRLWDFRTGKASFWSGDVIEDARYRGHGHGGGDHMLVRDLLLASASHDESKLTSSVRASVESHVMGFACEASRLSGKKVEMVM